MKISDLHIVQKIIGNVGLWVEGKGVVLGRVGDWWDGKIIPILLTSGIGWLEKEYNEEEKLAIRHSLSNKKYDNDNVFEGFKKGQGILTFK